MTTTEGEVEVKNRHYVSEKAYRKDLEHMLQDGWRVQGEVLPEGNGRVSSVISGLRSLVRGKEHPVQITYVRGGEISPQATVPDPETEDPPAGGHAAHEATHHSSSSS